MTCHHREVFRVDGVELPQHEWGHPKRCRCENNMVADTRDHCHQEADGEDMICSPCREICVGTGTIRLNIKQVPEKSPCLVPGQCPPSQVDNTQPKVMFIMSLDDGRIVHVVE